MAFLPLQNTSRYRQVFQASISAGANKYLLNFGSLKLPDRSSIIHSVGPGNYRLKISHIDIDGLFVAGIGIREDRLVVVISPLGD